MATRRALDDLDRTAIPPELEGQWVFVRAENGKQEILSSGDDLREVTQGQPEGPPDLRTRVSRRIEAYVVHPET